MVALCQFLPGPSSSQTGFAIGHLQRGLLGGLAVWLGFTLPSPVLMIALAYVVSAWGLALAAAAALLLVSAVWSQIAVIALGGAVGWRWLREKTIVNYSLTTHGGVADRRAFGWLAAFFGLLLALPILARATGSGWWLPSDRFYRTGSFVFGGGHVVLPLLDRAVVAAAAALGQGLL